MLAVWTDRLQPKDEHKQVLAPAGLRAEVVQAGSKQQQSRRHADLARWQASHAALRAPALIDILESLLQQ